MAATRDDVILLDGGMGQELVRRSGRAPTPLWSTQMMLEAPELVIDLHRDFAEAGADVLTLNNYAMTRPRLAHAGLESRFLDLQQAAIDAASAARSSAAVGGRPIRLAGCLPPLVSSYRPDLALPAEDLRAQYRELVAVQGPQVDVMLCETMPTIAEAVIATEAGVESGLETWCALTVEDADGLKLRSGEALEDAMIAVRHAGAAALLINCSSPEAVGQALSALSTAALPTGGYANGFVHTHCLAPGATVAAFEAREDMGVEHYADHVMGWIAAGATIVGGCCEIGPAHIAEIAGRLSLAPGLRAIG
ncbi:MAG: homocysteine S-methyltransferase family protein [Pseudomonadota bacterium]